MNNGNLPKLRALSATFVILSIFVFSGCQSYSESFDKSFKKQMSKERSGWDKATSLKEKNCEPMFEKFSENGTARENMMKVFKCEKELFLDHVRPVSVYPLIVDEYILKRRKAQSKFKDGKISFEEMNNRLEEAWIWKVKRYKERYRMGLEKAQMADQRRRGRISEALDEAQEDFQHTGEPYYQGARCGPNQVAPVATPGCDYVCIDGRWKEVCN